ncbi:hypothetical protein ACDP63_04800 [Paracoccus sp. P2]|mgnify:CR=1 FL=1|uniref:Uncharacterized protein n=1 Tax=Paracoccus pantotrophus TaxID=82367 RepID=A0A1I5E2A9_PARPN|nr:hypothetical protein [Paracoccus pantotrophus]MDF3853248.1 hypothetical protein [Paracoccus pantotrophus]QFG36852.1 hypothetical protein ESD82_11675 [Paracoccus pantotrophus]QLH14417.1 hypothetical protein HYQ43_08835 [Paracoccus pantotrophus]RDD97413.1 hypothetical protein DTW92_08450 [Paracoccus pantotrophus]RKS52744.1 hypothetical protein BDE18_2076 [Paracoccus pantotrophus]
MIPVVHQIQSRAGPAATPAAREVEIIGPTLARAQPEVPPVEESGGVAQDTQLGRQGVGRARQAASARAPQGNAPAGAAAEDADGPQDRAVFRAKVIRFLTAIYGDDESFQRALKLGTIVIRAVEDQPEPELRPELSHATYRHGATQAQQAPAAAERRGGDQPATVAAGDFIAWWPK